MNLFFCILFFTFSLSCGFIKDYKYVDICGPMTNSRKLYVDYGTSGVLLGSNKNRMGLKKSSTEKELQRKCDIQFITCPSCIIKISFRYLNISRTCEKSSVLTRCGCEYILIYEPPFKESSGEQYCGTFINNNVSELNYVSRTRLTTVEFIYTHNYENAFTLEFSAKRNHIVYHGYPKIGNTNNGSQIITSPFFPYLYPSDLGAEYVIQCHSESICRISLIFTDFQLAESSILEFFDWNGQRMYVFSGNIFRPPVIVTSGPVLTIRFYANGASDYGFKAMYTYVLGNLDDTSFKPDMGCGGQVNNLGGGITMMNMIKNGTRYYDCVWIIKPPANFLHRKTHLYVKIVNFTAFADTTELNIRHGLTSNEPPVEVLKYPMSHFVSGKGKEHVVSINTGFYISLRGLFKADSRIAVVYAAFSYKECFSGLDFLCSNLRCISILLNCDGFDHCGDNSDESIECSNDTKDHRQFSKIPNFLFPKVEPYADLTTATFVFLICTFGLMGIIFAMVVLLYRVNLRARHQRQIQDHIETIHAILEEGVGDMVEELIIPDEPPDYEPPPEYSDVLKYIRKVTCGKELKQRSETSIKKSQSVSIYSSSSGTSYSTFDKINSSPIASTSRSCQTSPVNVPQSPPPTYENVQKNSSHTEKFLFKSSESAKIEETNRNSACSSGNISSSTKTTGSENSAVISFNTNQKVPYFPKKVFLDIETVFKQNIKRCKSTIFPKYFKKQKCYSEENLVRYFSDSELFVSRAAHDSVKKKYFSNDDIFNLLKIT